MGKSVADIIFFLSLTGRSTSNMLLVKLIKATGHADSAPINRLDEQRKGVVCTVSTFEIDIK